MNTPIEQGSIRLLDADPGLGEGLPPEQELAARDQLLADVAVIRKGEWSLPATSRMGTWATSCSTAC